MNIGQKRYSEEEKSDTWAVFVRELAIVLIGGVFGVIVFRWLFQASWVVYAPTEGYGSDGSFLATILTGIPGLVSGIIVTAHFVIEESEPRRSRLQKALRPGNLILTLISIWILAILVPMVREPGGPPDTLAAAKSIPLGTSKQLAEKRFSDIGLNGTPEFKRHDDLPGTCISFGWANWQNLFRPQYIVYLTFDRENALVKVEFIEYFRGDSTFPAKLGEEPIFDCD